MPRKWDRANGKACPRFAEKVCFGLYWYSGWPRLWTGPGRRDFTKPTQPGRSTTETRQQPLTPQSIRKGKENFHFIVTLYYYHAVCKLLYAHKLFCLHSLFLNLIVSLFRSSYQCMTLQSLTHLHPSITSYCPPGSWFPFSCAGSTQCSADTHPHCCPRSPTFSSLSLWLPRPHPLSLNGLLFIPAAAPDTAPSSALSQLCPHKTCSSVSQDRMDLSEWGNNYFHLCSKDKDS